MRKFFLLTVLLFSTFLLLFGYEVVLLSDTHYDSPDLRPDVDKEQTKIQARIIKTRNWASWKNNMPDYLVQYRAHAAKADFVMHCGDISQGNFSDDKYQTEAEKRGIAAFTEGIPCKFYCIRGNHDTYCKDPGTSSGKVMAEYLNGIGVEVSPKNLNYTFTHQNDLYICVDYKSFKADFVRRALEAHPDSRYTFLVTHFVLLPCSFGPDSWTLCFRPERQKELRKLLAMLAQRNAVILCGDVHRSTLIRANYPEGTLTQVSVYSLPVGNTEPKEQKIDAEAYLNHKKPNGKPFLAEYLKKQYCGHYQEFIRYFPECGLNTLQIDDNGISMNKYDIKGKLLKTIVIKEKK